MSAPAFAIPGVQRTAESNNPSHEEIANLAYLLWQQRGAPGGTAEQDWIEAETQLRNFFKSVTNSARR